VDAPNQASLQLLEGGVPHDVTTNPAIAAATSEVLVAFRLDRPRRDPAAGPLLICELGAGSGRFSYHLLPQLLELCERAGLDPADFRVVLIDFCASHLRAWARHPRLQPFFDCGLADRARVDLTRTREPRLEHSGLRIGPGELSEPLVLIAHYLFDCISKELPCFRQGEPERGLLSLRSALPTQGANPAARHLAAVSHPGPAGAQPPRRPVPAGAQASRAGTRWSESPISAVRRHCRSRCRRGGMEASGWGTCGRYRGWH
jgi:hypothetical protein